MVKITMLTEKEIREIGEAFASHNYVAGEKGMYSYFKNKDAVRDYISEYARRAMKRGNLYSTSDRHEAYISFRTSKETMADAVGIGIARSLIRNMGLIGALDFLRRLFMAGTSYNRKLKREGRDFILVGLLLVTEPYQGQGYMRKVLDIAFAEGRKRNCPVYLETDGADKRDKYIALGMELVGTRKINENSYLYDLVREPTTYTLSELQGSPGAPGDFL